MDERALLRRAAAGDRAAFAEFYRQTAPWLAVRLRKRCADEQLVAEVVQDTYVAVWRAAGSFADGAAVDSVLGWLWRVAARRLVDAFRREGRHRDVVEAVAGTATTAPAAEDAVLEWTLSGDVGSALGALAPELRQVLQAMVLDGLTVRETSDLLGIPEGTVKTRARRARLTIREAMS
ncbi:MAG: RNA polymerase sigma factor [Umezawaea sp.]|jgi:RNA polymerase sigma-70 factor (ECF subfamily)